MLGFGVLIDSYKIKYRIRMENPNQKASVVKLVKTPEKKLTAREKIDNIMKKRDKKLEEKTKVSSKALLND